MTALHTVLAWIAVASTLAVLAVALATWAGLLRSYRLLDAALLGQLATMALAVVAGAAVFVTERAPEDGLHLLYGAVGLLIPIGTRIATQGRGARSVGRWVTLAALVAVGATFRSFMTGN